ncbi:isopentenyl phosphate kinase [Haloprofundus salinisoli]|uniref:isopentenyl phosphate kinase n=1 Tax=Haloprofundus salinisoli TaxID=2876193 RepID=UPI001CCC0C09|nr:isopentenyl phosphate kinase [Haloprofundus salinisoli]
MAVVLKLGGSVVTDKDRPETVDDEALDAAVDAVADSGLEALVVVHGGGSFGHHHAANHGVSTTDGTSDAAGALAIHAAMKRLNEAVVSRLQSRGVPALPVHPLSVAARHGSDDAAGEDAELSLPLDSTETLLGEGFVPVLHGDVVAHAGRGVTVVSGDELVVRLADGLGADRVGLCSTVPGVYDENEVVVDEIRSFEDVAAALGGSESTDVTGGMAAKVRALLAMDAPAYVFGPDGVGPFLAGESPGTRIDGR